MNINRMMNHALPAGFVGWVAYGESPAKTGYRELSRWSFDADEPGWSTTGVAFQHEPRIEAEPGQLAVFGQRGAFISSFHPELGSAATGGLESPELRLEADVISLRVAGGHDPAGLSVKLLVDGREVESLTGCDAELFYRWAWDTRRYRGRSARLLIEDHSVDEWGHLSIDEVVFWQRFEAARGTFSR